MRRRRRDYVRELALERIRRLIRLAEQIRHVEPELADRYGSLALMLARKAQISYPGFLKARVCRRCGAWLAPGTGARVRVRARGKMKYIAVTCMKCGYTRRYPLRREGVPKPWCYLYPHGREGDRRAES
ncbi:MAG: hypothetical protein QXW88_04000 [Thermofilum sp.]